MLLFDNIELISMSVVVLQASRSCPQTEPLTENNKVQSPDQVSLKMWFLFHFVVNEFFLEITISSSRNSLLLFDDMNYKTRYVMFIYATIYATNVSADFHAFNRFAQFMWTVLDNFILMNYFIL